jgi:hypothetical protein
MKKIMCLLAVLSLTACGGDDNSASSSNELKGTFKATMGDKTINVAVKCHYFDSDKFDTAFTFASDNVFGNKDTDGDGFIVRGDRINLTKPMKMDGIALDISDQGIKYETMSTSLSEFTKSGKGVSGAGKLFKAGSYTDSVEITYEVVCN